MTNQVSDQDLQQKIASLPKELKPERDLWAGIERATQHKKQQVAEQGKVFAPTAWAASIVTAVLVTWFTLSPNETNDVIVKQPNTAKSSPSGTPIIESDKLVTFMQDNFQQQRKAMLVNFGQPKLEQLPDEMQQQFQQLALARKSIKKALLADENNIDLLNLLDFTQQQELNLLQQLYSPQLQSI